MASITQRCGRYRALIRRRGHPPLSKTFIKKSDAEAWARKSESALERGLFVSDSRALALSFGEIAVRYEDEILPSKKSADVMRYRLRRLKRYFGIKKVVELTPEALTIYRDSRLLEVSSAAVREELGLLRAVLNACERDFGVFLPQGNPVTRIRLPQKARPRTRRLQVGEEEKLLNALATNPTVRAIVQLALETGMRRSELVKIGSGDVDLKRRVLHVREAKNGEPRLVPLSAKASDLLEALFATGNNKAVRAAAAQRIAGF